MPSPVSEVPAAAARQVVDRYSRRLSFETDCRDVWLSMQPGQSGHPGQPGQADGPDFVLMDVRAPQLFARSHVPGAISFPSGRMTSLTLARWPEDTLFVVYCAGPHCNGADRAALKLGLLRRPVKVMVGGLTGWIDEGLPLEVAPVPA